MTEVIYGNSQKLYKTSNALVLKAGNRSLAVRESKAYAADEVPCWDISTIELLLSVMSERDNLLISYLFDTGMRVSEGLSVRPCDISEIPSGGWQVRVMGKGSRRRTLAISPSTVARLHLYFYREQIKPDEPIFKITRGRVHQIMTDACKKTGVIVPDGVGAVHIIRHSGLIRRMELTGNLKAVQDQAGHTTPKTTMIYFKTVNKKHSLGLNAKTDIWAK